VKTAPAIPAMLRIYRAETFRHGFLFFQRRSISIAFPLPFLKMFR
jgi:hypothetical protein